MKHKKSGTIYAIKAMNKNKLKKSEMVTQIKTEIKIMYALNHENIIKLYNHFEDDNYVYLIIEFATGVYLNLLFNFQGQLWEKLQRAENTRLPEKQVAGV